MSCASCGIVTFAAELRLGTLSADSAALRLFQIMILLPQLKLEGQHLIIPAANDSVESCSPTRDWRPQPEGCR